MIFRGLNRRKGMKQGFFEGLWGYGKNSGSRYAVVRGLYIVAYDLGIGRFLKSLASVGMPTALQASTPKKLFQMPLDLLSTQQVGTLADTTRDLQRLLFVMPVQESAQRELDFVLNWQAGLRR